MTKLTNVSHPKYLLDIPNATIMFITSKEETGLWKSQTVFQYNHTHNPPQPFSHSNSKLISILQCSRSSVWPSCLTCSSFAPLKTTTCIRSITAVSPMRLPAKQIAALIYINQISPLFVYNFRTGMDCKVLRGLHPTALGKHWCSLKCSVFIEKFIVTEYKAIRADNFKTKQGIITSFKHLA